MSFNKDVNTYYVITSNNDEFGIGYYTGISKVREKKSAVFSSLEDYRVKKYKTKNRAEIELKKIKEIAKGEYSIIEIKKIGGELNEQKEKQFYCKLGQAVCNVMFTLTVIGSFAFYFVAALIM